jgi:hypothetical protein
MLYKSAQKPDYSCFTEAGWFLVGYRIKALMRFVYLFSKANLKLPRLMLYKLSNKYWQCHQQLFFWVRALLQGAPILKIVFKNSI